MKMIREVRNALDGRYNIVEKDKDEKKPAKSVSNFREEESRIVRKLIDLGLATPKSEKFSDHKVG